MPTLAEVQEFQTLPTALSLCTGCLEEGIAFLVLALGTLAVCLLQVRARRVVGPGTWLLLVGSLAVPFVLYYRMLPYAALILAAVALRGVGDLRDARHQEEAAASELQWWPGTVVALAVFLVAFPIYMVQREGRFPFGLGVAPDLFPDGAARFILRADARGPLFNSLGFGGYLLWSLYPRHQVFIHSDFWHSAADDRLIARVFQSARDPSALDALVGEYRIELLVLPNNVPSWGYVAADPRWALIYWDQVASVYARRGGANAGLIETREFRLTRYAENPGYLFALARDPALAEAAADELRRASTEEPGNWAARLSLASLLMARGQGLEEALREVEAVQGRGVRNAGLLTVKAGVLDTLGRGPEAEATAREAIRVDPGGRGARLLLADLRARAGDREEAGRQLRDLLGLPDLPPDLRREAEGRLRALASPR